MDSSPGWHSSIVWDSLGNYRDDLLIILPGESVYVDVSVTPPTDAYLGDTNSTELTAFVVED